MVGALQRFKQGALPESAAGCTTPPLRATAPSVLPADAQLGDTLGRHAFRGGLSHAADSLSAARLDRVRRRLSAFRGNPGQAGVHHELRACRCRSRRRNPGRRHAVIRGSGDFRKANSAHLPGAEALELHRVPPQRCRLEGLHPPQPGEDLRCPGRRRIDRRRQSRRFEDPPLHQPPSGETQPHHRSCAEAGIRGLSRLDSRRRQRPTASRRPRRKRTHRPSAPRRSDPSRPQGSRVGLVHRERLGRSRPLCGLSLARPQPETGSPMGRTGFVDQTARSRSHDAVHDRTQNHQRRRTGKKPAADQTDDASRAWRGTKDRRRRPDIQAFPPLHR